MENYTDLIIEHYNNIWSNVPKIHLWCKGPLEKMNYNFRVLEYPPTSLRKMWTYATVGMSDSIESQPLELHIFSNKRDDTIIELLTSIAYFHKNSNGLNLNHTVNFGRAWQGNSLCTYGYISLPYLDGPKLENLHLKQNNIEIKFYWLIPILEKEVNYKIRYGADALEEKFEKKGLDYLNR